MSILPQLLITDGVDPGLVRRLSERYVVRYEPTLPQEELVAVAADVDAMIVRSRLVIGRDIFTAAKRLRVVVRAGVGTDNIDMDDARQRGIVVRNVPAVSAAAVAELTVGLTLAVARHISRLDVLVRRGTATKEAGLGLEIQGSRVAIIGAGAIGARAACLFQAMGAVVTTVTRTGDPTPALVALAADVPIAGLDHAVRSSDIVSVHLPASETTRGLISGTVLNAMPPAAILVNTARASVVDEGALHAALTAGHLGGAGLDVLSRSWVGRFAKLDNVVLTPHVGAMTVQAQRRIGEEVERILDGFF